MTQLENHEQPSRGKPPSHEKKHVSQSQLELQALCRLFQATGGSTDEHETRSSWKKQTGWRALELAASQLTENLLARGTMETQFSLFGVTWERNHVVAIDLCANGLSGKIPSDIVHLRFLKTLKLRNNPKLRGTIPSGMYGMPHLRYCYLDGTSLEKTLPFQTAHSFQITQFHTSGSTAATMCFLTTNVHGTIRWTADASETEMFMMHSSLKALHERPKTQETEIKCNARNATGPERTAAATKLQRIYRARIERTKFRTYLKSLFQRNFDANTGLEYFVDARTGEATWEVPAFAREQQNLSGSSNNDENHNNSPSIADAWQPYDDGYGNTASRLYYWNSVTGESTWEPPVFLSRIYQELKARYGADKTDDERFELFFRDIDKDSTGEISKDEFALLCGELGMAMSNKQVDHVFSELDTSGDGELSRPEIIAWLTRSYT